MAQSIFFHNAADKERVQALANGLQQPALHVASPVPGAVVFGPRVVVIWSQHAAADYQPAGPKVPANAIVVQLDETPLPASLSGLNARMVASGDSAGDADRLARLITPVLGDRAAPAAPVARRAQPVARPVGAMRRRHAQSASVVTAAGAMGTLAAFALGAVVPAEHLVTPSFAAPNPVATPVDSQERHEHLAQTRQLEVQAQFQGVTSASGGAITFSAEEIAALNDRLGQAEQALSGASGWSDQAIARLQSLSSTVPEAMPAMAAVPQTQPPQQFAAAPAAQPAAPVVSAVAVSPVVLRERFAQVEPVSYAVDRIGEVLGAPQAQVQPLAALPPRATDG
jgi:hypothetical protein